MSRDERVWVAGEVLFDQISDGKTERALVGGGAANTARALAALGVPTSFIGGLSSDAYGQRATAELVAAGVDVGRSLQSELPTALAMIDISSGMPKYEFQLVGTATFDFDHSWLPSTTPIALHVGSLATIVSPGSSALIEWASGVAAPIIFDPNVRPSVLGDSDRYRAEVAKWFALSDVVKLSEEDLEFLYRNEPGLSSEAARVSDVLGYGPQLLVLTRGDSGISAFFGEGSVSIPSVPVNVIDTVGAGDTVGAVLLEAIAKYGLADLVGDRLFATLTRAARAAAITCSRAGAQPPRASELD